MTNAPDISKEAAEIFVARLNGHRQASIEKGFHASALFAQESITTLRAMSARIAELEAALKTAREDALKQAALICWRHRKRRGLQASTADLGIQRSRWIAAKIQAETCASDIEDLIAKGTP